MQKKHHEPKPDQKQQSKSRRQLSFQFRKDLRTAILMREILGPPRAFKPFQFPFSR